MNSLNEQGIGTLASNIAHANDCEVVQARIALRRARGE